MLKDRIRNLIALAITAAQDDGSLPMFDLLAIEVMRPRQADHGDYSCNVAMMAAAAIRKTGGDKSNPRQIAQTIIEHLPPADFIAAVELAGPGFINLRLADAWLQKQAAAIARAGSAFGNLERGRGQCWQVEYASVNPTGPLHYGGARNAALGDALANVLEAAGYKVQREFYVNDTGAQFQLFAESLYARYAQLFGRDEALPEGGYPGDYMIDYARKFVQSEGNRFLDMQRDEAVAAIKALARQFVVDELRPQLERMGVRFDNWFSEQSLYDRGLVKQALDYLAQRGELAEHDGALWFLASRYPKNDKDEVVVRSNGVPTYFASDIAYHYDKFLVRKFDRVVNVWGVDHQGHVPRMAAIMQALGLDPDRLVILMYDLVKLVRNGVEVKLSKRAGNLITLDDILDEVGADAVRFDLLSRSPESTIEFDLDLAVAQSSENSVFYVQYGYACICSILARAQGQGFTVAEEMSSQDENELALLTHPSEMALIRKLLELEEQIELAVDKLSPHNLPHYAIDLAKTFTAFYRDCRVIDAGNLPLSRARLLLSQAAQITLARVLGLLGVQAPESM